MAMRRGRGRGGRMAQAEDAFDGDDSARIAQLVEDRLAQRMDDRFDAFTDLITQRLDALTVANQDRDRIPNRRQAREEEENERDDVTDLKGMGYDYENILDCEGLFYEVGDEKELEKIVDFNCPPIFDDYMKDDYDDIRSICVDRCLIQGSSFSNHSIDVLFNKCPKLVDRSNLEISVMNDLFSEGFYKILYDVYEKESVFFDFIWEEIMTAQNLIATSQWFNFLCAMETKYKLYEWLKKFTDRSAMLLGADIFYAPSFMSLVEKLYFVFDREEVQNSRPNSLSPGENDADMMQERMMVMPAPHRIKAHILKSKANQ